MIIYLLEFSSLVESSETTLQAILGRNWDAEFVIV